MKKSLFIGALIAMAGLTFQSCEKLSTINENPNEPSSVDASVLFTEGVRSSVNTSVTQSYLLGNVASQVAAKTLRAEVGEYSWNAFPNTWNQNYLSLGNLMEAERVANEAGNYKMEGAVKVMKSWVFATLTLAYGDIPYTDAITGSTDANWFPSYDSQEDIITGTNGLLDELALAVQLLNNSGSVDGDILFNGDGAKWIKLANAMQLRLLMYVSEKQDVSSQFAAIVANEDLMSSNADNAALTYTGSFPNEYPLVPLKQGDFDAVAISTNALHQLDTTDDPRMYVYARPYNAGDIFTNPGTTAIYQGAENGSEACNKDGSRLGYAYYNYPGHMQAGTMAEGIIMTYAEQQFLLAEAAHNGWISDDAGSLHSSAVEASMNYYGADWSMTGWTDFSDFITNSGEGYDGSITSIRRQKWLGMFFTGLDNYFELRRWYSQEEGNWADLPFVSAPCSNTNGDALPMRFLYPGNEASLNPDNYQAAIDALGSNSQNAKMWVVDL
ncbi:MAG: SusD/RagB family nutrient-binding outer membrane lipoprotein [Cryomorphaceae bacterium]|nr:SusD/RagB family nutrient-binding outer membrane lipoprotein [Cryomorphaceae bacterium]